MQLRDFKQRQVRKAVTVINAPNCWECDKQGREQRIENKKRIIFFDGSTLILCLEDFMELMDLKVGNIHHTSYSSVS
jgi:hypothetical protein